MYMLGVCNDSTPLSLDRSRIAVLLPAERNHPSNHIDTMPIKFQKHPKTLLPKEKPIALRLILNYLWQCSAPVQIQRFRRFYVSKTLHRIVRFHFPSRSLPWYLRWLPELFQQCSEEPAFIWCGKGAELFVIHIFLPWVSQRTQSISESSKGVTRTPSRYEMSTQARPIEYNSPVRLRALNRQHTSSIHRKLSIVHVMSLCSRIYLPPSILSARGFLGSAVSEATLAVSIRAMSYRSQHGHWGSFWLKTN